LQQFLSLISVFPEVGFGFFGYNSLPILNLIFFAVGFTGYYFLVTNKSRRKDLLGEKICINGKIPGFA
jgi:uncharacterized BrkB/YihY/UPF0761 family membrane protein